MLPAPSGRVIPGHATAAYICLIDSTSADGGDIIG